MALKDDIKRIIKGEVTDDSDTLTKYSTDASIFEISPSLIVYPEDSEDIKSLIKFVIQNPQKNLSLTVRSGGTDMSGGAINDSIILDMTKHFNKILEIGSDSATVQPGVYYRDFEKKTLKKGLLFPSYPASREICTMGGIVANNAGGEKTLSYGQTKNYIKSLKIILSDGKEYLIEPIIAGNLQEKISNDNFLGSIYKKIYQLVEENFELIQKAKPKVHKNSSGYFLWDIWDKETFDLTRLVTGSQGTLGMITEITFKLIKPKPYFALLVINLDSLDKLDQIISEVLEFQPETFECFDDQTIQYAIRFLPEAKKLFTQTLPALVLMAQFSANSPQEVLEKCKSTQKNLQEFNLQSKIIGDSKLEEKYWLVRHESFNLLRHHSSDMKTAPFIDDIIVRPEKLHIFLPKLKKILEKYKDYMLYTIAGHIGEGNFHIIPLVDLEAELVRGQIMQLYKEVVDLVLEFEGSLTAEHNDGLIRGPYLEKVYGEEIYQLFKEVKNIFDPKNIFNPHKKSDATFQYSLNHMIKT
ncbi:MAG: putative oxidoreductase [Microgenomates group bacterium Gr01-1014_7]|nr:MAG: putative oxidoreductase [Microgenomates group bacterium Gr01-1014_7]